MSKILLVEDDKEIREIETAYLEKEGYIVYEAEDGEKALNQFDETKIDLIILDLNLPKIDGIDVCKQLRKKSPVPILMVTARTKEIDELLGLETGADDYIKKPFSPKILTARVKALLKRPDMIDQDRVLKFKKLEIDLHKRSVHKSNKEIPLTAIQFNILALLAVNKGKIFTREELMNRGYDTYFSPDIYDRTIDSHIKNIRKLIEGNPRKPQYIFTIRSQGYKFNEKL